MSGLVPDAERLMLRCDRFAPGKARRALGEMESIEEVREDALVVATELVSNAVLHAGCSPLEQIELVAERQPDALRISVMDAGRSGKHPVVVERPNGGLSGFGLKLVQRLSRSWGVERDHGVRVWAELAG